MFPIVWEHDHLIVYSYPLLIGMAWGISYHLVNFYFCRFKGTTKGLVPFFIGTFFSSWLIAKVLFLIVSAGKEIDTYWQATNFWLGGGFVFYGGLIGGIVFITIFIRFRNDWSFSDLPLLVPALGVGHAIGRLGCLLAGCCYGCQLDSWIAIEMHGVNRLPVPLFEALCLLLLSIITHFQLNRRFSSLAIVLTYFNGYAFIRFALEYLRDDPIRGQWLWFSTSQWISLFVIGSSLIILGIMKFLRIKKHE